MLAHDLAMRPLMDSLMKMDFSEAEARAIAHYATPTKPRPWFTFRRGSTSWDWEIGRYWISIPFWSFMRVGCRPFVRRTHRLYATCDADAPPGIRDSNGEVMLDLCRDCGRRGAELSDSCTGPEAETPGVCRHPDACRCMASMGNDFWFLPSDRCLWDDK
jgi:hypothetical protein